MIYCTVKECTGKTVDGNLCDIHLQVKKSGDRTATSTVPPEGILEKIKKMLALANDKCNVNESAVAASMAQKLLEQYNLSMSDLPQEKQEKCEKMDVMDTGKSWEQSLIHVIALANYCRAIVSHDHVVLVGRKSNTQICEYLYLYLRNQIANLAEKAKKDQGAGDRSFARAFCLGAVEEIRIKLNAEKNQGTGERGLTVSLDSEAKNAFDKFYPNARAVSRRSSYGAGYGYGQNAGRGISIHSGLSNSRGQALLA